MTWTYTEWKVSSRTLVLGSGISALAYLQRDRQAVALAGDQVGGLFAQQAQLGPQLIWVDELTTELLGALGLPLSTRQARVGYYLPEHLGLKHTVHVEGIPAEFAEAYAQKTRGHLVRGSYLSSGQSTFKVFTTPVDKLTAELQSSVELRLVKDKAVRVDPWNRVVHGVHAAYPFDTLISTVPAPVLLKLLGRDDLSPQLKARDKIYETWKLSELPAWAQHHHEQLDYIYVADSNLPYHRIKLGAGDGDKAVVEYTLPEDSLPTPKREGELLHRGGQIISGGELLHSLPPWVKPLGRYAEWQHGVKLNQVLSRIESFMATS